MNIEQFFIADPYNETHIRLFDEFEQQHQIETKTSIHLQEISTKYTKEEYETKKRQHNEVGQSLFLLQHNKNQDQITDSCHIMGEKDRKICYIYFSPIQATKSRKLVSLATNYVFNNLGMEEIFVPSNLENKNLIFNLEQNGYSSLGEDNGALTYLKEKETIKDKGRLM